MAAEFAVINPRRRRRRSRRRATTTRRRRRSTTTRKVARRNPHRRSRSRVRRHVRRARRNPGGIGKLGFMGVDIGAAALIGAGVIGSEFAAGAVSNFLPAAWRAGAGAPLVKMGVKAAVGIGVPWALRGMIGRRTANLLMTGTAVGLVLDAYQTWVAPAMGLTGYEQGSLGAYEGGQLGFAAGGDEANVSLGGSVYEGGVYD